MDIVNSAVVFLMEYVKKNMLLPGQIDYWVEINDFNKLSLKELPAREVGGLL
jgi:hypothetical protein